MSDGTRWRSLAGAVVCAVVGAWLARGVDPARLWVTARPMGHSMKVDFVPHGSRVPGRYDPLPAGIPFRLMHQRRVDHGPVDAPADSAPREAALALVHEGVTLAQGNQVVCPLPPHAALHVDEAYVLQGTQHDPPNRRPWLSHAL